MSIFTELEQKKLATHTFTHTKKNTRRATITVPELKKILSKNEEGYRATFLNFHVSKNLIKLGKDDYAREIIENLSERTDNLVKEALSNKEKFNEMASVHSGGLFITFLINHGTKEEPIWDKLENIIVNVATGGFKVKRDKEGVPIRATVKVQNTNSSGEVYAPYLHNPNLDNEDLCYCIDMIQRDIAFNMKKLKKTSGAVFFSDREVPQSITESRSLDLSNDAFASVYRRCNAKNVKGDFEAIPHTKPSEHFFNIRFQISKPLNESDVAAYNKIYEDKSASKPFKFKIAGKQVALKNNKVCLRYFNTERVGKEDSLHSILEFPIALSTYKSNLYDSSMAESDLYAYRRADENFAGVKNAAFTMFAHSRSQVINTIVQLKCFVNRDSLFINVDPVNFETVYIVRLENAKFAQSTDCADDGDIDIDDDTYVPKRTEKKRQALPDIGDEDIDEVEEPKLTKKSFKNLSALLNIGDDEQIAEDSFKNTRSSSRRTRAVLNEDE